MGVGGCMLAKPNSPRYVQGVMHCVVLVLALPVKHQRGHTASLPSGVISLCRPFHLIHSCVEGMYLALDFCQY